MRGKRQPSRHEGLTRLIMLQERHFMALIKRFEDLHAWQEARKLTSGIYRQTGAGPFSKDYGLKDQIQRAAVSSMRNLAEGFDCESKPGFACFLGIGRRSTAEVQSLLYVALDVGYVSEQEFNSHYRQAAKTKALIGGLKHSLTRRSESNAT
jgi:four helix bundle protein